MSREKYHRTQARKELLLARASIERLEFAAHVKRVKFAASPSTMLKSAWPRLTSSGGVTTAFKVWRTLQKYPLVSSAASMLLTGARFGGAVRLFKVGGAAFVAYEAYKLWRGFKEEQPERPARRRRRESGTGQD